METRQLKDDASSAFRKGKFGRAAELYAQLTVLEPRDNQHLIKMGDAHRRDGNRVAAVDAYRKAVDGYATDGVVIKAIAACKLILEIEPEHRDAQEALAKLCAKRWRQRPPEPEPLPELPSPVKKTEPPEAVELPQVETAPKPESEAIELETSDERPLPQRAPEPPPETRPIPPVMTPRVKAPAPDASGAIELDLGGQVSAPVETLEIDTGASEPAPAPEALVLEIDTGGPSQPPAKAVEPAPPAAVEIELGEPTPAPPPIARWSPPLAARPSPAARPPPAARIPPAARPPESVDIDINATVPPGYVPPGRPAAGARRPAAGFDLGEPSVPPAGAMPEDDLVELSPEDIEEIENTRPPTTAISEILSEALHTRDGSMPTDEELFGAPARARTRPPPLPVDLTMPPGRGVRPPGVLDDLFAPVQGRAKPVAPRPSAAQLAARAEQAAEAARLASLQRASEEVEALETAPAADATGRHATEMAIPTADLTRDRVPLFSELPEDAFIDLLEKLHFRRVQAGEVVLREGDPGKSIYVLASGAVRVVRSLGTVHEVELARLTDGAFFGEMALLTGAPRVASVVATEDSELLEITERILQELTARHPSVGRSLQLFYRQRLLANVMAISPLFRSFDPADRRMLVEKFKLREAAAGTVIIQEGRASDGLFVIMHGWALVTKWRGGRQVPLAALREGDVFGEMSLLTRQAATATVMAKRRSLVLRLPKAEFDQIKYTHPALLEVVSELTDQRTRVNEQILSGRVGVPRDVLALL